jgi:Spy/CpxP family protein refolding chaperone
MKTKFIAALALLLVATAAFAQQPSRAARLARYLELTPDQIAAWKQIHTDTAAIVQPLEATAHSTRTQLEAALKAATPDPAAVGKLAIALHATREQIRTARADARTKLVAVLTPEQKTKFEALEAWEKLRKP